MCAGAPPASSQHFERGARWCERQLFGNAALGAPIRIASGSCASDINAGVVMLMNSDEDFLISCVRSLVGRHWQ
jgi:hypothetical protein